MPSQVTLSTPTLSVAVIAKVTVSDWFEVDKSTVKSAGKLVPIPTTLGFWSSVLDILIVTLSVEVLPAASATVNVKLSVVEPKL